jgi:TPR repeat protein
METFATAKGDVEIIKEASEKLLATAKQGHPRAAAICGYSLYNNIGWPPLKVDKPLGKQLLIQARDAGDVVGRFWCAWYGIDEASDRKKAFSFTDEFHRTHPKHKDDYVLFLLGWCYYVGVGPGKDTKIAFELFQESAAVGNPLAMQYIGSGYVTVNGSPQAFQHSFKWWQKAAERGDARATYFVGRCFEKGDGVYGKHRETAIEWWKKAAALGNTDAIRPLAIAQMNE